MSNTVNAFNMNGTNKDNDDEATMPVSPFAVEESLTRMINDLKEDNDMGKKIRSVLASDMTTKAGQERLLQLAIENKWLKQGMESTVKVASEDGILGFLIFRESFSEALNFFWCSVEGNHRLIATLCVLFNCIPAYDMDFVKAEKGDDHYCDGSILGIESDDPFANVRAGKIEGEIRSHFGLKIRVNIMGSKKQATKEAPADLLVKICLLRLSRMISDEKHGSSSSTVGKILTEIAQMWIPRKDTVVKKTDGTFQVEGNEIKEDSKREKLKDCPYNSNRVLQDYLKNPSIDGAPLHRLLSSVTFKEKGTDKTINVLSASFTANTAILHGNDKSVRKSLCELIGICVAREFGIDENKTLALLYGNEFFANRIDPKTHLKDEQKEILGGTTLPSVCDYTSSESNKCLVALFITEWILAANLTNDTDVIRDALIMLNREMTERGEERVIEVLGE